LLGGKVPFGPVNKVDEIVNDPHVAIRSMIAEVPHPGTDVPVQIANTPIHMSKTPGGVRERAPVLGEHTVEVLTDWGFSADEIQRLRADDIVR
jgi:formyl-CoA transferase